MTHQEREEVIVAAHSYLDDKGMSANQLSRLSKINSSYLNHMLNRKPMKLKDREHEIPDSYFISLGIAIGMKRGRWGVRQTPQFLEILTALEQSKERSSTVLLIGETGCGKTYTVDKFYKQHPTCTYMVTASKLHSVKAIIDEILIQMGIPPEGSNISKVGKMTRAMQELKRNGNQPMLIIDEAENLKLDVLRLLKAIYDQVNGECGIALMGTPELLTKMEHMKNSNREGMPQFCSRFKVGTRVLRPVQKDFDLFLNEVKDKGLKHLLQTMCDNYRELRDYLLPVMEEAANKNVELTEQLFRTYHNISY